MKVVAYSIKDFEKVFLAMANCRKHEITLISNQLNPETAIYAEGKDAVIVCSNDDVSAPVINLLADMGIRYITTRTSATDHIDKQAAGLRSIKLANVPAVSPLLLQIIPSSRTTCSPAMPSSTLPTKPLKTSTYGNKTNA